MNSMQVLNAMAQPLVKYDSSQFKRYWRLFLAAELIGLILITLGTWAAITSGTAGIISIVLAIGWMWLIITLPICCCYLLGHPVAITLSPLVPSVESRAFWRVLQDRTAMTHEEFYVLFYADSAIPMATIVRVRNRLVEFHPIADRLVPADNLSLLDDELDLAEVLRWMQKEFHIRFSRSDYTCFDGTLDSLIRLTHDKLHRP